MYKMKNQFAFKENQALTTFYTMGNLEIKKELLGLLIKSISELHAKITLSVESNDPEIFNMAVHKAMSTITIIDDDRFLTVLKSFECYFICRPEQAVVEKELEDFKTICYGIIELLTSELNALVNDCQG